MIALAENSYQMTGRAVVPLKNDSLGLVDFEIASDPNSDRCTGAITGPQTFIDFAVAQTDVVLRIEHRQSISVALHESVLPGTAAFTCSNPLIDDAAAVATPAIFTFNSN